METLRVKKVPGRREGDNVLRDIDILQRMRQIAANHARHSSKTS